MEDGLLVNIFETRVIGQPQLETIGKTAASDIKRGTPLKWKFVV